MKIGLWGYFGNNNYGDDLLEKLAVSKIDTENNKLFIFSSRKTAFDLPNNAEYICHSPISFLKNAFYLDLLIIGPGGLFPSRRILRLIYYILVMAIMKMRRKKCILYGLGIGIGNFKNSFSKFLFKQIFKLSDKTVLRQDISGFFDKNFCQKHNITQAYDMLLSEHNLFDHNSYSQTEKSIVFCLANIIPQKRRDLYENFIQDIESVIKELITEDFSIKLIALSPKDDKQMADDLLTRFDGKNITYIEYSPDTAEEIFRTIGASNAVIAMRFHALITAIYLNTPTYCIAYSDKTEDICKRFCMDNLCQRVGFSKTSYYNDILPLDKNEVLDKIHYIIDNSESIVSSNRQKLRELQNETNISYDLINIIKNLSN